MVAVARQTLAPFGDWASAQRADAADLPFEDGRFSVVLPAAMLHHVMAWEEALAKAVRVLRSGGLLFGYDLLDVLATGTPYDELGENYFTTSLDTERETRRLVAKLEALGHAVTLGSAAA